MDAYLELLETAKKQYQEYVEMRRLCELVSDENAPENSQPPSRENPSTANENQLRWADPQKCELDC